MAYTIITQEEYFTLYNKLGEKGLTPDEIMKVRHYECAINDAKYGKVHEENHLQ